ncbi:TPA: hypothetical protein RZK18_001805 [Campylobacter coli]|nr:hypothetical protein [Campylobacter coli]
MANLSELRESLTYVIPLQELLENEDILGEAVNRYIKKSLSHLDLVTNFIESEEVYHKTKNFRKAVVHFTSNLVSGPIIAVGIVGGIRTGQVEVAVITIIHANDIPVAIENATNKAFDIYDNVLDAILEFIFNGTASRIITNFLNSIYERFLHQEILSKFAIVQKNVKYYNRIIFKILQMVYPSSPHTPTLAIPKNTNLP